MTWGAQYMCYTCKKCGKHRRPRSMKKVIDKEELCGQ